MNLRSKRFADIHPSLSSKPYQGQQVLNHNGAHILCDPSIDRATQPCGICLSPALMCQCFLTTSGTKKIDTKRSQCVNRTMKFTYSIASKSAAASPCSNVPLNCALCGPHTAGVITFWSMAASYTLQHLLTNMFRFGNWNPWKRKLSSSFGTRPTFRRECPCQRSVIRRPLRWLFLRRTVHG